MVSILIMAGITLAMFLTGLTGVGIVNAVRNRKGDA